MKWKDNNNKFIKAAENAGKWLLQNQVIDQRDANCGRFLYCCNIKTGEFQRSTNWQTGMGIIALLWLYNYTNNNKYLEAAERAAGYLLSLQVLDSDRPESFGGFREVTPQTPWMTTRDASSAAWGVLTLYQVTGKDTFLTAAKRFAEWQLKNAWQNGWPVRIVCFDSRFESKKGMAPEWVIQNNAQAGAAEFFLDLAFETGIVKYAEMGSRRMLDYYIKHFLEPSGKPHILYDPIAENWDVDKPGKRLNGAAIPEGWFNMHRLNDDFAASALLKGYQKLHNNEYLTAVESYAGWVAKQQVDNGGFGNPEVEVAASCAPLFLMDLRMVTGDDKYDKVIDRSLERLLELQVSSDNKMTDGGFLCLDKNCESDPGNWVNIRNSSYSIMALLKAVNIESGSNCMVAGINPSGAIVDKP
jgi:rhamnogalacturonyl hydrolase YesR